ncbi:LAMI_0G10000g1_1 [Lachancea mirantina]|uniref:U2 small nuclear ribonucleoprotein A' n=1 Tax=Lachancea mirantina TaxID=1230905 RepID=A0A1G4KAI5_9SACH|nr:LAMI_0G10000g1_1 [Lachancea mirantina]
MIVTPGIVLDAPTYYQDALNGKCESDKCVTLRDLDLETDQNSMPLMLTKLPYPCHILDLTNNNLTQLPPISDRTDVHTVLCSRNQISSPNGSLLPRNVKRLTLARNGIDNLEQLNDLKSAPASLENVNLRSNGVCYLQGYRDYVIQLLPGIKTLDFTAVSDGERRRVAHGAAKNSLETDASVTITAAVSSAAPRDKSAELMSDVVMKLDEDTREKLKDQLSNATTLEEIDRIEKILSGGV